jgi:GH18 family chitinase
LKLTKPIQFSLFLGSLKKFAALAHNNGLKALMAIGGWNEGSIEYSQVHHLY